MARVKNTSIGRARGGSQTYHYLVLPADEYDRKSAQALGIDLSVHYVTKAKARQVAKQITDEATRLRNEAKKNTLRLGEGDPQPTVFAWIENGKVVLARHWAAYGAARMLANDNNLSTCRFLAQGQLEEVVVQVVQVANNLLRSHMGTKV